MNEKVLSETQIEEIDNFVVRMKNSISQLKIRNWLEQFEYDDWDLAIKALSNLEYYSVNDLIYGFNKGLQLIFGKVTLFERRGDQLIEAMPDSSKLEKRIKKQKIKARHAGKNSVQILPVGKLGKSGSNMLYYVFHAPFFATSKFNLINHAKDISIKNENNFLHLVLVDDFLGSGDSVYKFINEVVSPELEKKGIKRVKIYVLCVVYMENANKNIRKSSNINGVQVIGTERVAAFSNIRSPYGYRPNMLRIREFCYKYGKDLYEHVEYVGNRKITSNYPLGYKNTQALIVFEHSIPNNTLPIFWSSRNKWRPLFPRNITARLNESSRLKNESRIWISIAAKIGYKSFLGTNIYSSKNIKLLCYIRLLKRKSSKPIISQRMNISEFELNEIIEDGIAREILAGENELTGYGEKLYEDIMLKATFRKTDKQYKPIDLIYVPKTFRGKT